MCDDVSKSLSMKAQSLIYCIVGQGGTVRLSSLRSSALSVRGFAPIAIRSIAKKFLQAFFKKPFPMNCSPFFSWFASFLCVTTKKRSYSLRYYLLYLLSYYFPYCLISPPRARIMLEKCRKAVFEPLVLRGIRLPAYLQADFVAALGRVKEGCFCKKQRLAVNLRKPTALCKRAGTPKK